jgi:hypothetical protein
MSAAQCALQRVVKESCGYLLPTFEVSDMPKRLAVTATLERTGFQERRVADRFRVSQEDLTVLACEYREFQWQLEEGRFFGYTAYSSEQWILQRLIALREAMGEVKLLRAVERIDREWAPRLAALRINPPCVKCGKEGRKADPDHFCVGCRAKTARERA